MPVKDLPEWVLIVKDESDKLEQEMKKRQKGR